MKKAKLYQQTLAAIASILTIVCMLIVPVNASSDTTAPQINGFSINKSSINAPDKVQITVNITDEGSGVNWVRVSYWNPSRSQLLFAHLSETSSGIWQGNLEFDRYAEEGTYTLWEIIAADVAGNQVDIYDTKLPAQYASQKITVSNAGSDTTAPQIKGFSISKNSINAPDKVQITVNIADEGSGVNWVRVSYWNPSRSQLLFAHLSETSSGIWQGNLEFDRYAEEGTYTLWEIIAADVAGNQVDIYDTKLPAEYASQKITVSNAINSDTTAPQINGFSINKSSINAPDKVQITVNITDEGSGVNWVRVSYWNPSRSQLLFAHLSETSSGIWQGNLEFDRYAEEGTYTLWEIIAADVAGNQVDIYDTKLPAQYASQKITVSNVTNPTTGNQGSEATKPSTGNQGSETTNPSTGNQGSETTKPSTGNQGSETTNPSTGNQGSETTNPSTGNQGSETTKPSTGNQGSEATKPSTGNQGSEATKPSTGNQGSEATKPSTGNQGSEATKPSTGNQGSEATKPSTGNQGSENTAPTTDNQSDEITDSTDDNNDQSALYIGLCITLAIVITCSIVVIVLKRKNKCRGNS